MALEKTVKYNVTIPDAASDLEKEVGVTRVETITENGQEIATSNHRYVIRPEDDWSSEPDNVKAQCDLLFTKEVIDARKKANAERMKELDKPQPLPSS
tara:strand:+ start:284 stop:577 length:294 start_codon:yes stop_codon:yes gene_type:complete